MSETKEEKEIRILFESLGYSSTKLDDDKSKRLPDFLFTKNNFRLITEIKTLREQNEMTKDDNITQKMMKLIGSLPINYNLSFNTSRNFKEQEIPWNLIKQFLINTFAEKGIPIGTKRTFFDFHFEVFGINTNSKPQTLGICGLAKKCNAVDCIRDDIKDSVKKFKAFSKDSDSLLPFLIVIYKDRYFCDDRDLIDAMYGNIVFHIRRENPRIDHLSRKNASLQSHKNTSVSAMAIYDEGKLRIFHNYLASIKIPYEFIPGYQITQFALNQTEDDFIKVP